MKLQFKDMPEMVKHLNKNTLTTQEYAKKIKKSYRTGKKHIQDGKVSVLRPKSTVLIPKKDNK